MPLPVARLDRTDRETQPDKIDIQEEVLSRNSAYDEFMGKLKVEMFYGKSYKGVSIGKSDEYIHLYNEKRINISLECLSPLGLEWRTRRMNL